VTPASASVGTSGNVGERLLPETPSATSLPARTCGSTVGPASSPHET